ncbi:hypothetical protein [Escherichia coli]|uniref:hypothetical protein n=1 Tax=Escherichia coli TaxID=562 RepID=UPI000BE61CCF|nr:hypothetical protein [Escherichia coli]
MSKITLTVAETISIVLNNDDVLSLVKQKYLESTPPEFDLSELKALVSGSADEDGTAGATGDADTSETTETTDSLTLSETAVSGKAGDTVAVSVTATGDSDVQVNTSDLSIATAEYADGTLIITLVAEGSATITLTKGDATTEVAVTVMAD